MSDTVLNGLCFYIFALFVMIVAFRLDVKTISGLQRKELDSCGKREGNGDPTGKAEEAPTLPAESKFLERKVTDNIYYRKQPLFLA
jgi:hypothetical protein